MGRRAPIILAIVLAIGCVRKEKTHSLYLDPDGGVTWMVLEKDIRSDAADKTKRTEEEEEFMADRRSGDHPLSRVLFSIGAEWVETSVLRDTRPFMVSTEARFDGIDRAFQSLFDQMEVPIEVQLDCDDRHCTLELNCDLAELSAGREEPEDPQCDDFSSLFEDASTCAFILTEGKFVDASGFEIKDDGTRAELKDFSEEDFEELEARSADDLTTIYALTWQTSH